LKTLSVKLVKLQTSNNDEEKLYRQMTEDILLLGQELEFVNAIFEK
jgi:hypothetical protein